jgi:bifunctional UDP-N-acetylglucosamine pyrophosphorylase/glucosamine-1-phosphate N-acetyltransferase
MAAVYGIREKPSVPSSNLANAGAYLFSRHIFDAIRCLPLSERGEYELTSAIQLLIDKGFDFGWHELGSWITFSYPWDLLTNGAGLYQNLDDFHQSSAEDNVIIRGRVGIGANTIIRSGSYIEGPVYIGSNCRIGPNCYIRPATAIGDGCHIGTAVEIKNSL